MQEATDKNTFYAKKIQRNESREARVLKFHHTPTQEKEPKKYKTEHYFSVKNHPDLFDIGKHYLQLSQNGKKNFAFYSSDSVACHHTLLGISSFFNYHEDLKSTIFVESFDKSELVKLLKNPIREERVFKDEYSYEFLNFNGIEVVEYDHLRHVALKMGAELFSQFISSFIAGSSISLCEMPKIKDVNRERELFFPLIKAMDSLSVVIEPGKSSSKEVKEVVDFSKKYDLKIDGVLFSPVKTK